MQNSKLIKAVLRILFILGTFTLLYLGKPLLITLVLGGLLALSLNPIHDWLMSKGWSSGLSITACLFLLILFFSGLFAAVGFQGARFVENWPEIQEQVLDKFETLKGELAARGGNTGSSEASSAEAEPSSIMGSGNATTVLSKLAGILGNFTLMFVYVALFLSQKQRLREFMLRRMPDSSRGETHRTMNESRDVAVKYLRARFILIVILTVLYSIGFLIVGLDYAVIIALLAAVLSIIPYLGNIIGGMIALALAFTGDGGNEQIIGIIITMGVAQFLESYILTPLIVGKEVSINPLTTIIAVVGFNIIWGPVGAIVAIPIIAMIKIVCEHVPDLQDYAYLLGEDD